MSVGTWLPVLQTAVAALTIIGVGHSVYRGTIGEVVRNTERIPHIEQKVDEMEDAQEDITDAVVLLTHAQANGHVDPDPEAIERDLRDEDEGPARYAADGRIYSDGNVDSEDERAYPKSTNPTAAWKDTPARPESDEP
jgi:hypothetical protein